MESNLKNGILLLFIPLFPSLIATKSKVWTLGLFFPNYPSNLPAV
jgi:hypothetical protein